MVKTQSYKNEMVPRSLNAEASSRENLAGFGSGSAVGVPI
jgi:hypothetical protein